MPDSQRAPILVDTSVLINFLAIDRIDLLAKHPDFRFMITEHVRCEVTKHYADQLARLERALGQGGLEETRVESIGELAFFAQLIQNPRLGLGECAAIAAAIVRAQPLAIDDKAARRAASDLAPGLSLMDTQSVIVSLLRAGTLTIEQADAIKTTWEKECSFKLRISSFAELL